MDADAAEEEQATKYIVEQVAVKNNNQHKILNSHQSL